MEEQGISQNTDRKCECCGEYKAEYYSKKHGKFLCDTCACMFALNAPLTGSDRWDIDKMFHTAGIVPVDVDKQEH